jgi:hypothetical protein
LPSSASNKILTASWRARTRTALEIQQWVARETNRQQTAAGAAATVNITGSNNIVQAGISGSTASIIIDAAARDAIREALAALRDALQAAPDGLPAPAEELHEMLAEGEQEVAKEAPNKTKLATILSGLAIATQTVAALEPAYLSIRKALEMMGLGG